jgi:glycerol-3-phosphate dehydrogenase
MQRVPGGRETMGDETRFKGASVTHPFSARGRTASLDRLAHDSFDLLVVGGGITGAGIARDAAMRGLRVALVERDDFASGTSSRSSRLVHGGLRYLEHGHLHLVYEASRERRTLLRIAPHLVRPLPFLWPVFERSRIPMGRLRAGLFIYDALALFRNVGHHRMLSPGAVAALEPAVRRVGLRGGAMYYDAATDDSRLTLATLRAAAAAGATVVNHVAMEALLTEGDAVRGGRAVTTLSGRTLEVRAQLVVNAAGPWGDAIRALARPDAPRSVRGTKGVHVAVPHERIRNTGALVLLSPIDGRVMFVLPSGALTIIGTTDTDYSGPLDSVRATTEDIAYLLRSVNAYFPGAHLTPADVVSAWAGVRPLVASGNGAPSDASREHAITWTAPGLLSVTGGKLTTYRAMAAEAVDRVAEFLGRSLRHAPTDRVPLPGGDMTSLESELAEATSRTGLPELATHLVHAYGTEWRAIWSLVEEDRALAAHVAPGLPYVVAELHWAVEQEMALTLADLLIRRLHVAFETRDHGQAAAPAVARVIAPLLAWNAEQIERELARYSKDVRRMFGVEEEARPRTREETGVARGG